MAAEEGMAAVARSDHFSECIRARPANRERLLQTDVRHFIETMTRWREYFLQSANLPIVGATEADLRSITAPACLIAGNDVIHTPQTARKAASLIPNSELQDNVVEWRSDDNLLKEWDRKEWREAEPRMAEIFASFLRTAEIDKSEPERKH
jgi:pimeloyl-ACP methyl ester carboxylesterase